MATINTTLTNSPSHGIVFSIRTAERKGAATRPDFRRTKKSNGTGTAGLDGASQKTNSEISIRRSGSTRVKKRPAIECEIFGGTRCGTEITIYASIINRGDTQFAAYNNRHPRICAHTSECHDAPTEFNQVT